MAAVTIARHLGLEVFATASPGKHAVLRGMGFDEEHIASSRGAEFDEKFLTATGGAGMDIVLNSLTGELTDASLKLLPRGGQLLELGTADVRDPARIASEHPGVAYQACQLGSAGAGRPGEILARVVDLLAQGELTPPPVRCLDVRRAPDALRFMSQGRHTGKIVLAIPPGAAAPRRPGTVLVTGGTGTLGGLVARHLAGTGKAREVLLVSRSGPAAAGAAGAAAAAAAAGAGVRVVACDASDRDALAGLVAGISAGCPLTGVVHAAGVVDDGIAQSLTGERVAAVMRPKSDAAGICMSSPEMPTWSCSRCSRQWRRRLGVLGRVITRRRTRFSTGLRVIVVRLVCPLFPWRGVRGWPGRGSAGTWARMRLTGSAVAGWLIWMPLKGWRCLTR